MHSPGGSQGLDLPALEQEVIKHWEAADIIRRVSRHRAGAEPWVTFEGPPTVNGSPALHHVYTSIYKDVYARYQTMRGKFVDRRAGWDCQGLPVEIATERKFGLKNKQDIEKFGIDSFVAECRELVAGNIGRFESVLSRAGYWVDYDRAYKTMDDSYLESVWWHIKQMWNQGLVQEGHRVVPYCTRCGTALSSHELAQPGVYRERDDEAAYVGFPTDSGFELVIWTTTPWTLPANIAVAVHPQREYGVYSLAGRHLVVATDRAGDILGEAELIRTLTGSELVGLTYERPYPEVPGGRNLRGRVIAWQDVDEQTGSGLVHIAPSFGEDDWKLGSAEDLPVVNPVDERGRFTEGSFEGELAADVAERVTDDLQERGLLVRRHLYRHQYPHCWRCQTPLIYWAKPSWFIQTSTLRDSLIRENDTVNWHPENIKHGRFGNWLKDNVDWAVARDRYWGTPLPIWRCESGHVTCVGSRAELSRLAGADLDSLSLHRPAVDEVAFPCPDCGREARRVAPVCDVWLDSGCVPAAQSGHPHQANDFEANFPADFICEAIDQTRGWFYSLLAVNVAVYGKTPYKNVVCLGHLVDDEGRKMSKSIGNVIDPVDVIPRFGADGIRWYLYGGGAPWGPRRVSMESIEQRVRRDLDTIWNVASFYLKYAEIESFTPGQASVDPSHGLDRWLRSRLNGTVAEVTRALDSYEAHVAAAAISEFIDDLSNWYVRRGRRRFWGGDESGHDAFQMLWTALMTLARMMAPFCPFYAESLYHSLGGADTGPDSVHLADWPEAGPRDPRLEADMAAARQVASLAHSVRAKNKIPVKQALRELVVVGGRPLSGELTDIVSDETNVLTIGDTSLMPGVIKHEVRPNWRRLGARFGGTTQIVAAALKSLPPHETAELQAGRAIVLTVDDDQVTIEPDDVALVETVESGWAAAAEDDVTVVLNTTLDDELLRDFHYRNAIRKIQLARRAAGLSLTDRILLWLDEGLWERREFIAKEVLATRVDELSALGAEPAGWSGEGFVFSKADTQ